MEQKPHDSTEIVHDVIFVDEVTRQEHKAIFMGGDEAPYAVVVRSDSEVPEIHSHASLEIDRSHHRARYVLKLYEKVKDHPTATFRIASVITGVAVSVATIQRIKHKKS